MCTSVNALGYDLLFQDAERLLRGRGLERATRVDDWQLYKK